MSLGQKLKLELDDGREVETAYDGRDLRAWESKHRKSALTESLSIGMLTWLGHHAAIRRGELNGDLTTYEAFDKVCVSVEGMPDEEADQDPDVDPSKPRSKGSRKKAGGASSAPS